MAFKVSVPGISEHLPVLKRNSLRFHQLHIIRSLHERRYTENCLTVAVAKGPVQKPTQRTLSITIDYTNHAHIFGQMALLVGCH